MLRLPLNFSIKFFFKVVLFFTFQRNKASQMHQFCKKRKKLSKWLLAYSHLWEIRDKCLTFCVTGSPDTTCTAKHCISSIPKILKILISRRKAKQNKEILYLRTDDRERHNTVNGEKSYNAPFTPLSVTMAKLVLPHVPAKQKAS